MGTEPGQTQKTVEFSEQCRQSSPGWAIRRTEGASGFTREMKRLQRGNKFWKWCPEPTLGISSASASRALLTRTMFRPRTNQSQQITEGQDYPFPKPQLTLIPL